MGVYCACLFFLVSCLFYRPLLCFFLLLLPLYSLRVANHAGGYLSVFFSIIYIYCISNIRSFLTCLPFPSPAPIWPSPSSSSSFYSRLHLRHLPYIYKPHLHFFKIFSSSKSPTTSTHLLLLLFPSSTPYLLSPHTLHLSRTPISFILNVPHLSSTLHSPLRNPHLLICSLHYTFKSDIVSLTPSLSKLHSHRI